MSEKHNRTDADHSAMPVRRLTEVDVPKAVMRRGMEMMEEVIDPQRCGDTDVVEGWNIETHTLGCRNQADESEKDWWSNHWAIYDEFEADPLQVVMGDPGDGRFVTFAPTRRQAI